MELPSAVRIGSRGLTGLNRKFLDGVELMESDRLRKFMALNLVGLTLSIARGAGCQRTMPSPNANTAWHPKWETVPDKNKKAKPRLSPTITFTDAFLGFVPTLDTGEQKKLHEQDTHQKELFIQAFGRLPECKGVTFIQKNPQAADFDVQIFNGLDGRTGRWQWVLYQTDTTERLAFGEEMDVDPLTKSVCTALHASVEPTGGRVE